MSYNAGDFVLVKNEDLNAKDDFQIAHLTSIKGNICKAQFYLRQNDIISYKSDFEDINDCEIFLDAGENGKQLLDFKRIYSKCLVEQCPEEIDPRIFLANDPSLPVYYVRKAFDGYQMISLNSPLKSPNFQRKNRTTKKSPPSRQLGVKLDFNCMPPARKSKEPSGDSPCYRLRSPLHEMTCRNVSDTKIILTRSRGNTPSKADSPELNSPKTRSRRNASPNNENVIFSSPKSRSGRNTPQKKSALSLKTRSANVTPSKESPHLSPRTRSTRNTPCKDADSPELNSPKTRSRRNTHPKDDTPLVTLPVASRSRGTSALSSPMKELSVNEDKQSPKVKTRNKSEVKEKMTTPVKTSTTEEPSNNEEAGSPRTPRRACKDSALLRLRYPQSFQPVNKFLDLENPPRRRKVAATRRVITAGRRPQSPISPLAKSTKYPASPTHRMKKLSLGSPKFKGFSAPHVKDYDDANRYEVDDSSDTSSSEVDSSDDSDFEEVKVTSKRSVKRRNKKRPMESPVDQEFAFIPKRSNVRRTGGGLEEARARLHVAAVPKNLPCRDEEFEDIYAFIEGKLLDGIGGCIYISGLPGTGKTATVHEVMRSLEADKDLPEFLFIEVNGMRVTEPNQAFVHILQKLTGKKATPKHASQLLEKEFCSKKKDRKPCVLIVDELDLLCTKKQEVLYNLFDWPGQAGSRLVVVAIANTMDLPERLLHHRVASRLGLTRLTFQPYTYQQLNTIVVARLQGLAVFESKAVELAARKVAAVSGDARRALDICRRATELAEQRCGAAPVRAKERGRDCQVQMEDIDAAIREMFSSAKLTAIRSCSVYEKLFLRGLVSEFQRTGLEEARLDRVMRQMVALCRVEEQTSLCTSEMFAICASLGSHKLLLCESARQDSKLMIRLNCGQHDVTFALKDALFRVN